MCSSGKGSQQQTATPAQAAPPPNPPPEETEIGAAREEGSEYDDTPDLRVSRKGGSTVAGSATAGGSGLSM